MARIHGTTQAGRIPPTPLMTVHPPAGGWSRPRGWFCLVAVMGAFALAPGGRAALHSVPPAAIDIAAAHVASALAEGVAIALAETPQDKRGLVMIGTLLDDVVIKAIQQSPADSRAFVEKVAARYPLSAEAKRYFIGALIGLGEICRDFPPPPGNVIDPYVLKLILAFRHGVRSGVENHRASGRSQATSPPQPLN